MSKLFILDVYNFINAQRFDDGCVPEEKINTEELLEDIKSVIITQESIIGSRDKCIEKEIRKNNELQKCIAEYNTTRPYQSSLYREVKKLKQDVDELQQQRDRSREISERLKKALNREINILKQQLKRSHELNAVQPLVKRIESLKVENEKLKQQNETFKNTIINVLENKNDVVCCDCGQHESHKKIKWTYCTDDTDKQLSSVSPVWCCEQCLDKGC
tara:strand:+ start:392 stop:1042 length:651 start_codon:yes stop_codon:yes gene_type:complete